MQTQRVLHRLLRGRVLRRELMILLFYAAIAAIAAVSAEGGFGWETVAPPPGGWTAATALPLLRAALAAPLGVPPIPVPLRIPVDLIGRDSGSVEEVTFMLVPRGSGEDAADAVAAFCATHEIWPPEHCAELLVKVRDIVQRPGPSALAPVVGASADSDSDEDNDNDNDNADGGGGGEEGMDPCVARRLARLLPDGAGGAAAAARLRRGGAFDDRVELAFVAARIECGLPTAVVRWNDSEWLLMNGLPIEAGTQSATQDGLIWAGGLGQLGLDLHAALSRRWRQEEEQRCGESDRTAGAGGAVGRLRVFHGLPCPVPFEWIARGVLELLPVDADITFSTVFSASNYPLFHDWITRRFVHPEKESEAAIAVAPKPVLVVNEGVFADAAQLAGLRAWTRDVLGVPSNGPDWWQREGPRVARLFASVARAHGPSAAAPGRRPVLFLVAAGAVGNVLIDAMLRANPRNSYVDVGSSLDAIVKGRATRPYMLEGHELAAFSCSGAARRIGRTPGDPRKLLWQASLAQQGTQQDGRAIDDELTN